MAKPTMEDRVLIRELYSRLYWAHNFGDAEGVQACFAPGGHTLRHDGEVRPPATSGQTAKTWSGEPVARTRQHHVTNIIVDPDEDGHDDRRKVRAYFFVTEVAEPPLTRVRWSCYSNDTVQKVDGEWLFFRRQITLNDPDTG